MMKSTQKGNQYEKEVKTILEAQDWMVEGQHRKVMWIRDKYTNQMKMIMAGRDIYGCDLIAKKQGEKTRWIQVSTLTQKSAKQKQVMAFPWTLEYESVELWLRLDGKRAFRVFILVDSHKAQELGLEPRAQFIEAEQQVVPKRGDTDEEQNADGSERFASEVASEHPE